MDTCTHERVDGVMCPACAEKIFKPVWEEIEEIMTESQEGALEKLRQFNKDKVELDQLLAVSAPLEFETVIQCDCSSSDHMIILKFDHEWGHSIHLQLNSRLNFFQRIGLAFKYIFGFKSKYGHWEETLLTGDKLAKIRSWLNFSLKD